MKTPFCVMKDSAMSEKSKISILSNDLIRRMLSCSETIPDTERNEIIDRFAFVKVRRILLRRKARRKGHFHRA